MVIPTIKQNNPVSSKLLDLTNLSLRDIKNTSEIKIKMRSPQLVLTTIVVMVIENNKRNKKLMSSLLSALASFACQKCVYNINKFMRKIKGLPGKPISTSSADKSKTIVNGLRIYQNKFNTSEERITSCSLMRSSGSIFNMAFSIYSVVKI